MSTATLTSPRPSTSTAVPVPDRKQCSTCDRHKPLDDFPIVNRASRGTRRAECKQCNRDRARATRAAKAAEVARRRNLRIRNVLAEHPRTADAADHLNVNHDTVIRWKRALNEDPDVELRVWGGLDMGDETLLDLPQSPAAEHTEPTIPTERPVDGWKQHAACRDEDADLWFGGPERPGQGRTAGTLRAHEDATAEAKAICERCPVKAICLAEALTQREQYGIWGGLTPDERKPLQPTDTP